MEGKGSIRRYLIIIPLAMGKMPRAQGRIG